MHENMCAHCLETGDWEDEDKCPSCEATGHTSPWRPSRCEACNKIYFDGMKQLIAQVHARQTCKECGQTIEDKK